MRNQGIKRTIYFIVLIFPTITIIFFKPEEVVFGFGLAFVVGFFGIAEQTPKAIHAAAKDHGILFGNDVVESDDIVIEMNITPFVVVFHADLREA